MRVVAGSEGATDKSTPDCPHCTLLYCSDSVLSCAYNQPVMPEDALCFTPLRLNKPPKTNMHRIKTPGRGLKKIGPFANGSNIGPFGQTRTTVVHNTTLLLLVLFIVHDKYY